MKDRDPWMLDTYTQSSSDQTSWSTDPTGDCRQASALTKEGLGKPLGHLMQGVLWPRARAGTSSPHSSYHETDTQTCSSSCVSADMAGRRPSLSSSPAASSTLGCTLASARRFSRPFTRFMSRSDAPASPAMTWAPPCDCLGGA